MCNFITLRASGGGAVYCNRSCLCVMVVVTMMVRSSLCHTVLSHSHLVIVIIIIIRSRRQQRSVASTQSGHDDEPWTIQHEC